jgi:hypothetical protein
MYIKQFDTALIPDYNTFSNLNYELTGP